jgi:hypothetical protein
MCLDDVVEWPLAPEVAQLAVVAVADSMPSLQISEIAAASSAIIVHQTRGRH